MTAVTRLPYRYLSLLSIPLFLVGLWPEWRDFFRLWYGSIIYNHGYLVLAGIAYLLYVRRHELAKLSINGSAPGLILLAGASIALLFAQAADIRFVRLALVPLLIVFWGWSIWGRHFVSIAAGPILLLLFAVPFWDDFSTALQHITVFFNDIFLRLADIEATISEFFIVLEVGTFLVEGGCSGVRYLMVALFLGSFYGQLYYHSATRTALLMIIAGMLSMLANWIRVFGIIAAGHYSEMETSLVDDHELFGWIVFLLVTLVPLFFVAARLEPKASADTATTEPGRPVSSVRALNRGALLWPAIASVLIIWPALATLAVEGRTKRIAQSWQPTLPELNASWRGPLPHADIWQPDYQNPDVDLSGVYVSDDLEQVQVQITGYRRQTQNKELIFYGNQLFNREDWQLISSAKRNIPDSAGDSPARINETIIQSRTGGATIVLWTWYDIGGVLTDSRIAAKLTGALKKITGDNRGALWALAGYCSTNTGPDCQKTRAAFERFLAGSRG